MKVRIRGEIRGLMMLLLCTWEDAIVVGMDYDCKENQLYWSDVASQTISRVTLDRKSVV